MNTFSPEGRLFQVEYAVQAIKLGSTVIGIETSEGVVLAAEKRLTSSLLEPWSIEKIVEVDSHIGCGMSGLTGDGRTLVERARVETQAHRFTYNEPMSVKATTQAVCDVALSFSDRDAEDKPMSRPFGVALLMAGVDDDGPVLYQTDPSGTFLRYKAVAIGAASEGANTHLEEQYNDAMTLEEAIRSALAILKQVMEDKISNINVEVGIVPVETGAFRLMDAEEIQTHIDAL